jgi:anti-anti-sigma regulatory factor
MPTATPPTIRYAVTGGQLYLAFEGSATHRVSLATEHLTAEFFAQHHAGPTVVVDLSASRYLDSTFAGWMIKLQHRLKPLDGRIVLSRCPDACRANLRIMGLASLFEFEDVAAPAETRRITCSDDDEDEVEAIELMLRAHEHLADVNNENEHVFTPVAESLRRELDRRR